MKNSKALVVLAFIAIIVTGCKNESKSEKISERETENSEAKVEDSKSLSNSPRHHEWVTLSYADRELEAFVVYPEKSEKAKSIIVIHENRGLNDWARLFADKLAGKGYLVIAPDLISNTVAGKRKTTDFEDSDAAREAIYALDKDQVTADLDAAYQYIKNDPASTGHVAVVGFCWGGSQTFRYATNNENISSAHVFYGTAPDEASELAQIKAPVYAYYGGNDARVNSTIEETEELMKEVSKTYEYKIYEGAGHAFMRSGHQPDAEEANKKAHDQAWKRLLELLEK